jgi:predicted amidohydrolase
MVQSTIKIGLVQIDTIWENTAENIKRLDILIDSGEACDLLILPETFTTGFSMSAAKLSDEGNRVIEWLEKKAKATGSVITGSIFIKDNDKIYNRLIWMDPSDKLQYYNKRHLFRMGRENEFTPGNERKIFDLKGWRVNPLICYDLRFPVWSRNRNDYDLLLYVANWPAKRNNVWNTLLKARAIENQAYVAGVNRIGIDGEGIEYHGESQVVDFKGEILKMAENPVETIVYSEISISALQGFRHTFPVSGDADDFILL